MKLSGIVLFSVSVLVLISEISCKPSNSTSKIDEQLNYRLPNNTTPLRFDVYLQTDIHRAQFNFTGNVVITIKALENTNNITLHYRRIDIKRVTLKNSNNAVIQNSSFRFVKEVEFLVIESSTQLVKNNIYILEIDYDGEIRDDNNGFYRSSYTNEKNETVYLATTQFAPTDGRHAFPCYDEPAIRAVYSIKIRHHKSYSAVSNMPMKESFSVDDYNITNFQDTPPMQTYLIAFVVSDFKSVYNLTVRPPQHVYARSKVIDDKEADFALETGLRVVKEYEKLFGIEYLLPKLDQIAILDYNWGAMENWGLVTYREEILLYNPEFTTTRAKQTIFNVICHEYSHNYFGNLVNPKWWSYVWLNEGFATLFEFYTADLLAPEMRMMDSFILNTLQRGYDSDSKEESRPMTYYVETPGKIFEQFDDISYRKAGSVLRMFHDALGGSKFIEGVKKYLSKMQLRPAEPEDLFEELQKAFGNSLDIKAILREWERQGGYPVVTVSRNSSVLEISQERFLYKKKKGTDIQLWSIPLNYVVGSNPEFKSTLPDFWMKPVEKMTLRNESAPKSWTNNDWLIFNVQSTGFYRVNYDENLWKLIIKELTEGDYRKINVANRAKLIDDSLHLARAGKLSYLTVFDLLSYMRSETDYLVWGLAEKELNFLNRIISSSKSHGNFLNFMGELVNQTYTKYGTEIKENAGNFDRYSQEAGINWACRAGIQSCLDSTSDKMMQNIQNGTKIHPDLQAAIFCNSLRKANESTFNIILERLENSQSQGERTLLAASLACSENAGLLKKLLDRSLTENFRIQERRTILVAVIENGNGNVGLDVGLGFIEANAAEITKKYREGSLSFSLSASVKCITSSDQFNKFTSVLTSLRTSNHIDSEGETNLKENAQSNVELRSKVIGDIEFWLTNYYKSGSSTIQVSLWSLLLIIVILIN